MFASSLWLSACAEPGYAAESSAFGARYSTSDAPRYALDGVSRWTARGPLACDAKELVTYRGEKLRYDRPLRVHPAFRERLVAFEQIVDEVARQHFGRAPRKIVHLGSFACRTVRGRPELVSEHALGNALDVAGFDFGPLPRKADNFASTPPALRRAFQVRLDTHWSAEGASAPYARFLRALAERIVERPDVFRVVLGPGWPGHHNHFHLDNAPYRLIGVEAS